MWICEVIFLFISPALWGVREPLGFPTKESPLWHSLGFMLRAVPAIIIIHDFELSMAYGFYFWIAFEFIINYRTKKDLFYMDKSTLSGQVLTSFYIDAKVIFWIKLILMTLFLLIKYL